MGIRGSDYTITSLSFADLTLYWRKSESTLNWDCIFVLPPWLEVWWREFGPGAELCLCVVKQKGTIIGFAPLLLSGREARFIGSADVCDCLDFVLSPGGEQDFFNILLDDLRQRGIRRLSLEPLKPDSTVLTHLVDIAKERGHKVSCKAEDVSLELDLPPTWEEYLRVLNGKQRHEVRRKLRRLEEVGEVNYRVIEDSAAVTDAMEFFLRLFRESREDKAVFMTANMESFFRSLAKAMTEIHLLKISILELDASPVAAIMCFDYNDTVYLYNSGYDPQYSSLSVGLTSKILCIKDPSRSPRYDPGGRNKLNAGLAAIGRLVILAGP